MRIEKKGILFPKIMNCTFKNLLRHQEYIGKTKKRRKADI